MIIKQSGNLFILSWLPQFLLCISKQSMVLTPPLHTHTQTPFISQFKKHRPKRQSALLPSINNNFLKEEEEIKKKKKKKFKWLSQVKDVHIYTDWGRALRVCAVLQSPDTVTHSPKGKHYLVLGHRAHNEGTDHSREGSHSVWDPHENAGIAGGNVQVVDIKTYSEDKHLKIRLKNRIPNTFWKILAFPNSHQSISSTRN